MKNYVQDVGEMKTYLDKRKDSVYIEESRPENKVRVWLSYDVEDGHEDLYDKLYTLFNGIKAEPWGNSVATFLIDVDGVPTNEKVARKIVHFMFLCGIVKEDDFENGKWKNTKGLSIYVIYRYSYRENANSKPVLNSDHFVLMHNAPIKHLKGWKYNKQ